MKAFLLLPLLLAAFLYPVLIHAGFTQISKNPRLGQNQKIPKAVPPNRPINQDSAVRELVLPYDSASGSLVLTDGTWNYAWYANGTLKSKTSQTDPALNWQYEWNVQENLTKVTKNTPSSSTITEFSYDVVGNRIEKKVNGVAVTYWLYVGEDLLAELNGQGETTKIFTQGQGTDEHLSFWWDKNGDGKDKDPDETDQNEHFYFISDHLGSTIALTDKDNVVTQKYEYNSYGLVTKIIDKDGNTITPQSPTYIPNPYTYTGRAWEPEIELMYYRARWYSPEMKRFISEDPIWSGNLYGYVGNNPINYIDPFGDYFTPTSFSDPRLRSALHYMKRLHDKGIYSVPYIFYLSLANAKHVEVDVSVGVTPPNKFGSTGFGGTRVEDPPFEYINIFDKRFDRDVSLLDHVRYWETERGCDEGVFKVKIKIDITKIMSYGSTDLGDSDWIDYPRGKNKEGDLLLTSRIASTLFHEFGHARGFSKEDPQFGREKLMWEAILSRFPRKGTGDPAGLNPWR